MQIIAQFLITIFQHEATIVGNNNNSNSPCIFVYVNRDTTRWNPPTPMHHPEPPCTTIRPVVLPCNLCMHSTLNAYFAYKFYYYCIELEPRQWRQTPTFACVLFGFSPLWFAQFFFAFLGNYVKWKSVQFLAWHLFVVMFFRYALCLTSNWIYRIASENTGLNIY